MCVKVGLGTKVLGATNIKKGRSGVVKVQLKNTGRASANSASATFAIPRGFSVTKKPAGATVRKSNRVTLNLRSIAAGKTKTVSLTLKAGAKASPGSARARSPPRPPVAPRATGKLAVTIRKA